VNGKIKTRRAAGKPPHRRRGTMPTIPVRLDDETWKAFKIKLIQDDKTAQMYLMEKIKEYIKET
jgi:hypothetical protein